MDNQDPREFVDSSTSPGALKRYHNDYMSRRFATIVEDAFDPIISKDLNGIVLTWNKAAERMFGYTAQEMINRPIDILVPANRHDEEISILERIRNGERVNHYETARRRKNGSVVDVLLTISPVRDETGAIVGASTIVRDITQAKQEQEQQRLVMQEMDHRAKNLFTLANAVVSLSVSFASTPDELAEAVRLRLASLSQAHSLTLGNSVAGLGAGPQTTTLRELIQTIVAPFGRSSDPASRVVTTGDEIVIKGARITDFALLLHEFASNAAKYGALSILTGRIDINLSKHGDLFVLTWTESGGPLVPHPPQKEGFGSFLTRVTVKNQLGGQIHYEWRRDGLTIILSMPYACLV